MPTIPTPRQTPAHRPARLVASPETAEPAAPAVASAETGRRRRSARAVAAAVAAGAVLAGCSSGESGGAGWDAPVPSVPAVSPRPGLENPAGPAILSERLAAWGYQPTNEAGRQKNIADLRAFFHDAAIPDDARAYWADISEVAPYGHSLSILVTDAGSSNIIGMTAYRAENGLGMRCVVENHPVAAVRDIGAMAHLPDLVAGSTEYANGTTGKFIYAPLPDSSQSLFSVLCLRDQTDIRNVAPPGQESQPA